MDEKQIIRTHHDRWHEEVTKEVTWCLETYIVWECSLDLGDSIRLSGRNDIWEG